MGPVRNCNVTVQNMVLLNTGSIHTKLSLLYVNVDNYVN